MSVKEELEKLLVDARFGKDKHFSAAGRSRSHHYWLGIPVILISIFLGSMLFNGTGLLVGYERTIGAVLTFFSALLVSLQTFLNPKEIEKGHRSVGNRYLEISRKCRLVNAKFDDKLLSVEQSSDQYEHLLNSYNETNIEAEAFPISSKDFKHAIKMSKTKIT